MPRFIFIDTNSGYIWGDTNECVPPGRVAGSPEVAAEYLDDYANQPAAHYTSCGGGNAETVYWVYLAPHDHPEITDGQDAAQISAVEKRCEYLGGLKRQLWAR